MDDKVINTPLSNLIQVIVADIQKQFQTKPTQSDKGMPCKTKFEFYSKWSSEVELDRWKAPLLQLTMHMTIEEDGLRMQRGKEKPLSKATKPSS
jgi:hypothetical protein